MEGEGIIRGDDVYVDVDQVRDKLMKHKALVVRKQLRKVRVNLLSVEAHLRGDLELPVLRILIAVDGRAAGGHILPGLVPAESVKNTHSATSQRIGRVCQPMVV